MPGTRHFPRPEIPVPEAPLRPSAELQSLLGQADIYLIDQLLRGRFDGRRRVLDAGCGDGRNLVYFLQRGFECFAIDRDPAAVEHVRALAARLSGDASADRFVAGELDGLPWGDGTMDAVLCSAVLHFAADEAHFGRMLREMWRVLAPGGLFFARLASNVGIEDRVGAAGRRVRLPDGSERFVVDEAMLLAWTERLGGRLLDPLKTTIVQGQRCMTTWCVVKST
jgi:SAM-dependent methyltransferase